MTVEKGLSTAEIASTLNSAEGCQDGPQCKYELLFVGILAFYFSLYSSYDSSSVISACKNADLAVVALGTGESL